MERDASYMTNEALSNKVAEHDVRIATLESSQKEMQSKVDDIHDIATSVKVMFKPSGVSNTSTHLSPSLYSIE